MGTKRFHVKFIPKSKAKLQSSRSAEPEPVLIACLHKIYPGLLLLDQCLDKMLWHIDDVPLQFIYIISMALTVGLLLPQGNSLLVYGFDLWAGYVGAILIGSSMLYYIHTLFRDLERSEAPTIDEINHTLESVLEKLSTVRDEVLGPGKSRKIHRLDLGTFKFVLLLTIFQFLFLRFFSLRQFVVFFCIQLPLFHSVYYQSTMKLFWRSLWIRRAYYCFWKDGTAPVTTDIMEFKVVSEEQVVPFPKSLQGLKGKELQIQLQTLIIQDSHTIDPESDYVRVKIVEFRIDENERKWNQEGWTRHLLSYERTHFCNSFNHTYCMSPWKFQEDLPTEWIWVDDSWIPSQWRYCDSEWTEIGTKDSIACFTRRRTWRRKAFQIIP